MNQISPAVVEASINALVTPGTNEIANLAHDMTRQTSASLENFNWFTRNSAQYAVQRASAKGLVEVMRARAQAAAANEIGQLLHGQTMSQMVTTALMMRDESKMQQLRAMVLSEFTARVLSIVTTHEAEIDTVINARIQARSARREQGVISPEQEARRRAHDEEQADRLVRGFDNEINDMIDQFRLRLRKQLSQLFIS